MKITLTNNGNYLQYEGTNERDQTVHFSGNGNATSPMESVLMASAACSSVDIEMILEKMKQDLRKLDVIVEGKRAEERTPKVFTEIHLHYVLTGEIKEAKAASAVEMSVEKYCSVMTMLMDGNVKVTHSFEVKRP